MIEEQYQKILGDVPGLAMLWSNDYSSLTPGYVVLYKGTFASRESATQYCNEVGRETPSKCYAKLVLR